MKRVFRKAIAFLSAVAVAASMAVSASAASAAKRIVKNSGYKQVVATESGLYFTNFSESEIKSGTSNKTVLCVTPDGKKKKVKVDNSAKVNNCNMVNSSTVFSVFGSTVFDNTMALYYNNTNGITDEFIFANGKKLNVDPYAYTVGKCVVLPDSHSSKYSTYLESQFVVYDENGKKVETIPYFCLKDAPDYVRLSDYDSETKTALFRFRSSDVSLFWLVKDNKTVKKIVANSASLVKDKNGDCAVQAYVYDSDTNSNQKTLTFFSANTGKKLSKFKPVTDLEKKYTVEESGSKYSVKKDGKVIYSIAKKKAAGYYVYDNSVAIITKTGSKYGLIMVK